MSHSPATPVRILLVLAIGLIAYGSLYPFQANGIEPSLMKGISILVHSWPQGLDRNLSVDVILNVLIYIPIGLLGLLSFTGSSRISRIVLPILLTFFLSASMEIMQAFLSTRVTSMLDLAANTVGGVLGVIAGLILLDWMKQHWPEGALNLSAQPGVALLLCFWLSAQWIPFIPAIGLYKFHMKWTQATAVDWSTFPWEALAAFATWTAAIILFKELAKGAANWCVLLPALFIPAKFFIASQQPTSGEFTGAAMAILGGWTLLHSKKYRMVFAAWILGFGIFVGGLAPFNFGTISGPFSWIPFSTSLQIRPWDVAINVLFAKAFRYGATLWLMNRCGIGYLKGSIYLAVMLALIEWAQTYLPHRSAESTDVAMVFLLALILKLAQPAQPSDRRHRSPTSSGKRII